MADTLNNDGRRDPNGKKFDAETLYIPEKMAESPDVVALIKHACKIEYDMNAERLKNNFLLVTLRVDDLQPGQSLGQTGWHVDGHQGAERLQPDGKKVPIDRVYAISNEIPTQLTNIRLNLDPLRKKADEQGLT